jgi:drug/metabolite transporter (DMT)-like permease
MAFLFIVIGTFMWSLDTLIRYPLLSELRPDTMVFIEHAFLTLYFVPFIFFKKFDFTKIQRKDWFSFFFIGVIGSAASTLAFTKAFSLINPSLVILLQKLQPLVVITASTFILKEKISKNFLIYAFFALAGALLISVPDLLALKSLKISDLVSSNSNITLGYALTIFAVLGWGFSTVFGKKLALDNWSESEIMAGRFIFGFVFLSAYCFQFDSLPSSDLTPAIYLKVLAMVFVSGLLGMYLYYRGLKQISAQMGSIAEMFFPLSAVIINWIFLGKQLSSIQIAGGVILILSSILIQRTRSQTV